MDILGRAYKPFYRAADNFCNRVISKTKARKLRWEKTDYGFATVNDHKLYFRVAAAEVFFQPAGAPWTFNLGLTDDQFSSLYSAVSGKAPNLLPGYDHCHFYTSVGGRQLPMANNSSSSREIEKAIEHLKNGISI